MSEERKDITPSLFSEDLYAVIKAFGKRHDINKFDNDYPYYTPLGCAIKRNNLNVFKYLIERGADINKKISEGNNQTPLWLSVINEKHQFIEILLKIGAQRTFYNGYTLLTYVIDSEDVETLSCLLKCGQDVNEMDKRGWTPLIAAVKVRNFEMVKSLLDYGAEFTVQSALLEAIFTGEKEIVELLIERGAAVNFQSVTGFTPLTKATSVGILQIAEILIKKGADVNMLDIEGNSPLINSIRNVHLDLVQILVENGANIQQADGHGNLPITEALHTKCFSLIKFLIENGAKWNNIRDKNGYSPLTQSVQERNFDMLKFFLDRKADVNELDNNQKTALILAVEAGNVRFVKMLTERGALVHEVIENIEQLVKNNDDWSKFYQELEAEKRILEHSEAVNKQM